MNRVRYHNAEAGKVRKRKLNKSFLVLLSLVLLVSIAAGATVAYLTSKPEAVSNSFVAAEVTCEITEGGAVKNTGNVPVYIRVAVVTSLQNKAGEQYAYATTINDLSITTYSGWSRHDDGYFYYSSPVQPGDTTTVVGEMNYSGLTGATLPEGFDFVVDMFAEAIQAEGLTDDDTTTAVYDAWKQTPSATSAG